MMAASSCPARSAAASTHRPAPLSYLLMIAPAPFQISTYSHFHPFDCSRKQCRKSAKHALHKGEHTEENRRISKQNPLFLRNPQKKQRFFAVSAKILQKKWVKYIDKPASGPYSIICALQSAAILTYASVTCAAAAAPSGGVTNLLRGGALFAGPGASPGKAAKGDAYGQFYHRCTEKHCCRFRRRAHFNRAFPRHP